MADVSIDFPVIVSSTLDIGNIPGVDETNESGLFGVIFSGEVDTSRPFVAEKASIGVSFLASVIDPNKRTYETGVFGASFSAETIYGEVAPSPQPDTPHGQDIVTFDYNGCVGMCLPLIPCGLGQRPSVQVISEFKSHSIRSAIHTEQRQNDYRYPFRSYTFDYVIPYNDQFSILHIMENIDRFVVAVPLFLEMYRFSRDIASEETDFYLSAEPEYHLYHAEYVFVIDGQTKAGYLHKITALNNDLSTNVAPDLGSLSVTPGAYLDYTKGRFAVFPVLVGWIDSFNPDRNMRVLNGSLTVREGKPTITPRGAVKSPAIAGYLLKDNGIFVDFGNVADQIPLLYYCFARFSYDNAFVGCDLTSGYNGRMAGRLHTNPEDLTANNAIIQADSDEFTYFSYERDYVELTITLKFDDITNLYELLQIKLIAEDTNQHIFLKMQRNVPDYEGKVYFSVGFSFMSYTMFDMYSLTEDFIKNWNTFTIRIYMDGIIKVYVNGLFMNALITYVLKNSINNFAQNTRLSLYCNTQTINSDYPEYSNYIIDSISYVFKNRPTTQTPNIAYEVNNSNILIDFGESDGNNALAISGGNNGAYSLTTGISDRLGIKPAAGASDFIIRTGNILTFVPLDCTVTDPNKRSVLTFDMLITAGNVGQVVLSIFNESIPNEKIEYSLVELNTNYPYSKIRLVSERMGTLLDTSYTFSYTKTANNMVVNFGGNLGNDGSFWNHYFTGMAGQYTFATNNVPYIVNPIIQISLPAADSTILYAATVGYVGG